MQSKALEDYFCDGLLIHPIIGPKKVGDFSSEILLKSYQILMNNNFLNGRTLLAGFNSYPRYCGPREAVFTALCRKNFGCSHFIIGRDHTGVGNHYSKDSMDNLFEELGDLGIKPIFFDNVKYDKKLDSYFTLNSSGSRKNDYKSMSGTEAREMLRKGKSLPGWYMRKEISKAVIDEIRNNSKVFLE
jgi:ATP sulfurylase